MSRYRIDDDVNQASSDDLIIRAKTGLKVQVVQAGTNTPVTVYQAETGGATHSWFGSDARGVVVPFTADPETTGVPIAGGQLWVQTGQEVELRVLRAGVEVGRKRYYAISPSVESSVDLDACTFGARALPGIPSDQGAAIQQAIDQARANVVAGNGPRRVFFSKPGVYTVALRNHPTSSAWATGVTMKEGVELDLTGVTLKLIDYATLPDGVVQQGYIVGNDYSGGINSGVQTGRFVITGGELDGNGANQRTDLTPPGGQFNGALFAAMHLNRAHRPLVVGTKVKNVWGTGPAPPVGSAPGGESFAFMTYRCDGATFINCEASGEGLADTATGWNDTYGHGTTHIDCVAHHFQHAMGFSTYQTSHTRYVGCWAHSCAERQGFNAERCDHLTYTACISGGKLRAPDDTTMVPYGYATNGMSLGNYRGWSISGCYDVTIDPSCQSAYNVAVNVSVDVNTVNYTRASNRVAIYGTHLHCQTGSNRWFDNVVVGTATISSSAFTGTLALGSKTMSAVAAGTGTILAGQEITGTGIPNGTIIEKYDSAANTITMSLAATTAGTGVAVAGSSDVYVRATISTNATTGTTVATTEASGQYIKEYANLISGAAGQRFQSGRNDGGWAMRWNGIQNTGVGLGVTAKNQLFSGGRVRSRTATATNYTVLPTDDIIAVTSTAAARTITLPVGSSAGEFGAAEYEIVDESQAAATNNIIVARQGTDTFLGGFTVKVINTNGGGLRVYWNGANWIARAITAIV